MDAKNQTATIVVLTDVRAGGVVHTWHSRANRMTRHAVASRLAGPPHTCLAVKDLPACITSAAAGCPVGGVRTTYHGLAAPTVVDLTRLHVQVTTTGITVHPD